MPQYTESIITYLDILGFREIIKERSSSEIAEILDVFKQTVTGQSIFDDDSPHPPFPEIVLFSDMAVRSVPIRNVREIYGGYAALCLEIILLCRIQCDLIEKGILIRGGLTIGDIFIDKDSSTQIAFGPGLISAYELEAKHAIFPRIIVEPVLFEHIKKWFKEYKYLERRTGRYPENLVRKDSDGLHYIDYLRFYFTPPFEDDRLQVFIELLLSHKQLINAGRNKFKWPATEVAKYSWLTLNHNSVVDELDENTLQEAGFTKESLLIEEDALFPD